MSRSGYSDDCDDNMVWLWRGAVKSAIEGRRGQALLRDLLTALDAMPEKVLIEEELVTTDGKVCALGALGVQRGLDVANLDPYQPREIAAAFGVAPALVQEIEFVNDEEGGYSETPQQRWSRVRAWVAAQIK